MKKIEKILDKNYILGIFQKKKDFYFPDYKSKKISKIEIERISPIWYRKTCLSRYKVFFSGSALKIFRGSATVDGSKKEVFKIMKCLHQNGFDGGKFQIPRPLDYIPQNNLLLYEEARGVPLASILEKKQTTLKIFNDIAESLFKIHSFKKIRRRTKIKTLNDYKKAFKKIAGMFPELAPELIPLKKIAFLKDLSEGSSFIHGDFYPGNIIIDRDKIFIIDFDRAGLGSFLEDLSSLCASLEFPKYVWPLNFSAKEIKEFQEAFLTAYSGAANINYVVLTEKVKKFSIKSCLEPLYYTTGFAWNSWHEIDNKTKKVYFFKIKGLLLKLRKCL